MAKAKGGTSLVQYSVKRSTTSGRWLVSYRNRRKDGSFGPWHYSSAWPTKGEACMHAVQIAGRRPYIEFIGVRSQPHAEIEGAPNG